MTAITAGFTEAARAPAFWRPARWPAPRLPARPLPGSRLFDCIGALAGAAALGLWAMATLGEHPATGQAAERQGSGGDTRHLAQSPEWLNGGYFGMPYTYPSDIRFEQTGVTDLTVHGVHWDGKPFKSQIGRAHV